MKVNASEPPYVSNPGVLTLPKVGSELEKKKIVLISLPEEQDVINLGRITQEGLSAVLLSNQLAEPVNQNQNQNQKRCIAKYIYTYKEFVLVFVRCARS